MAFNLNSVRVTTDDLANEPLITIDGDTTDHDTTEDSEYVDIEEEDLSEGDSDLVDQAPKWTEKVFRYFEVLRHRYQTVIPRDISKLLNRGPKQGKTREPSILVQYLIFSNTASFIYYYRLWNCTLKVDDHHPSPNSTSENDDDFGIPLEDACSIC